MIALRMNALQWELDVVMNAVEAVVGCALVPLVALRQRSSTPRVPGQGAALLQLFSCVALQATSRGHTCPCVEEKQRAKWQPGAVELGRRYLHKQVKHVRSVSATSRRPGRRMALEINIRGRSDEGLPIPFTNGGLNDN